MGEYLLQPTQHIKDQERVVEQFGEYWVMKFDPPGMVLISKGTPDDTIASFNQRVTEVPDLTTKIATFLFRHDNRRVPYGLAWTTFTEKMKELFGLEVSDKFKPKFVDDEDDGHCEEIIEDEILEDDPPADVPMAAIETTQEVAEAIQAAPEPLPAPEVAEEPQAASEPVEAASDVITPANKELKRTTKVNEVERTAQVVMQNTVISCAMKGKDVFTKAKTAFPDMDIQPGTYQAILSTLSRDERSNIRHAGGKAGYYLSGPNPEQPQAEDRQDRSSAKHSEVDQIATQVLAENGCDGEKTMAGKEVYRLSKIAKPDLAIDEGYFQGIMSLLGRDSNSRVSCAGKRKGYYLRKDQE